MDKPYSIACERNSAPILKVLQAHFQSARKVLEVGSGNGQHAVYFAQALPHLVWQCSDRALNHAGIRMWLSEANLSNTPDVLTLDVGGTWPVIQVDAIFSANTLHIMSWPEVELFFQKLPSVSQPEAKLVIYGPFNYGGKFTSESNAVFDASLKAGAVHRGIRDIEAVNALAEAAGFSLIEDNPMPANNRCLVWQRS